MYLQSKNRYLKTAVVLGILVSLGSISSANAGGKHKHRHHHHETWVVHDVYIVDTRPPLISPASVAVTPAPARCETPASSPAASNGNYHTQHKFLVNDDGITTVQQAAPGQHVQLNYYDE